MKNVELSVNRWLWRAGALLLAAVGMCASDARAGTAFNAPVLVNFNPATTLGLDDGASPAVAARPTGTLVAVWSGLGPNPVAAQGQDSASPTQGNEDIFFSRSVDYGRTWTRRAQIKTTWTADDADDLDPSIATDGNGNWVAVWRSRDTLGGTLGYDSDILAATSTDDGLTWSDPVPVNTDAASDGAKEDLAPRIDTDGRGCWVVSWTVNYLNSKGARVEGVWAARSTDNGLHWSAPFKLLGRALNAPPMGVISSLATDGNGRWMIMTRNNVGGTDDDIFLIPSTNNGLTWNVSNQPINPNGWWRDTDLKPAIATDRQGAWIIAWHSNSATPPLYATSPTFNIWFIRSNDNGATWGPMTRLNSENETGGADNTDVHLANDGNGNWIAAWITRKWGGDTDLAYAVSRNNGTSWSLAAPLNAGALNDAFSDGTGNKSFDLTTDRQGHWFALWDSNNHLDAAPGSNRVVLGAALNAAEIACTPTALNYLEGTRRAVDVTQNGKPTTATLTLQSTGLTPLTISGLQIGGPHAADFSLQEAPQLPLTLAPGTSQTLAVRFAPTLATRTLGLAGQLTVTSNDSSHTALQIPLIGDAVPVNLSHFKAD